MALCEGNEKTAKYKYIKFRVEKLIKNVKIQTLNKNQNLNILENMSCEDQNKNVHVIF